MLSSPSIEVTLCYQLSRGEHAIPRPAVKKKKKPKQVQFPVHLCDGKYVERDLQISVDTNL